MICLGGANTGPSISPVIADPVKRGAFIKNLIAFTSQRGYDGIDVDMEPILPADEPNFVQFVRQLRAGMKAANPNWLLTIPASGEPGDQPKLCAELHNDFDQINIQTYDLSGAWEGWKTWYNGSLYGEGSSMLTGTRPYPSVAEKVNYYLAAGVPARKLGIGIAFYGYVWSGANGPTQSIAGVTTDTLGYNAIMDQYFQPSAYRWDALAHAPYLSIGGAQGAGSKFISYDDPRLAREKVLYARTHGLGGVIIWEIGDGYRASQPVGHRNGPARRREKSGAGADREWIESSRSIAVCILIQAVPHYDSFNPPFAPQDSPRKRRISIRLRHSDQRRPRRAPGSAVFGGQAPWLCRCRRCCGRA